MTALRFTLLAAVAALAAAALPGSSLAGNECNGVPKCISVPGPWVFVPVRGEAGFLLECPGRRGVVAGLDAQVTSQDVRVTFDGLIASPVAAGRTTTRYAFFRAVSSSGKRGAFEPRLGCIPSNTSRNTLAATPIKPLGAPLDLAAATLVARARLGAAPHARLRDGRAPRLELGRAHVRDRRAAGAADRATTSTSRGGRARDA